MREPPKVKKKGRPQTQRLTGATEGCAKGGGGRSTTHAFIMKQRKCGVYKEPGHTAKTYTILRKAKELKAADGYAASEDHEECDHDVDF